MLQRFQNIYSNTECLKMMQRFLWIFLGNDIEIQHFYIQPVRRYQKGLCGCPRPMCFSWKAYW